MRIYTLLLITCVAGAQPVPRLYDCRFTKDPPRIDGKLDDAAWRVAAWSDPFVDIEGDKRPKPRFRTRMKMLWDRDNLYIAAEMEDPHLQASLTQHDSVIFRDNDFEVFIDPNSDQREYSELELNALNTTWDLFLPKPYNQGGKAQNEYEIAGLKTAVHLDGTLNDPSDTDRGWTVEIAIPWAGIREKAPHDQQEWRINFSRVEWKWNVQDGRYVKPAGAKEDNWVWSPQGAINMHIPERWGYVRFSLR